MSQDDRRDGGNEDGDVDDGEAITWVGSQWLMDGYCGRAPVKPETAAAAIPIAMPVDRPIAVVRTRRHQPPVVRIGPRRVNDVNEPPVEAGGEQYANQGSVAETAD